MKYLIAIVVFLFAEPSVNAQSSDSIYTLYLVRHAEKVLDDKNDRDPELTECGNDRAKGYVDFFQDLNFSAIYSTDYKRTRSTAKPLAQAMDLETSIYNHRELQELVDLLKKNKRDSFVVGHSNSTANLASLLVGKEIPHIDHSEYSLIFQVVICEDQARLHILKSDFKCD